MQCAVHWPNVDILTYGVHLDAAHKIVRGNKMCEWFEPNKIRHSKTKLHYRCSRREHMKREGIKRNGRE